jgi:hypothetical protein
MHSYMHTTHSRKRKEALRVIESALEAVNEARFLFLSKEIDPHTGWTALDAIPSISTKTASCAVARRPNEEVEQVRDGHG